MLVPIWRTPHAASARKLPSVRVTSLRAALLAAVLLPCATPPAPAIAQALNFRQYTGADGLPQAQVMGLHQDREGYIWFATYGGLTRYDGGRFRTYSREDGLASNSVYDITEDAEGRLYLATDGGVCIREQGSFSCRGRAAGLLSDVVRNVALDPGGGIWAGTLSGLSYIHGDTVRNFTPADGLPAEWVVGVVADSAGRAWIATQGGLVRHERGRIVADPGDPLSSAPISFVARSGGGVLVGTHGRLFLKRGDVTIPIADGAIPASMTPLDAATAADGTIWVATRQGALRIRDGEVRRFTRATGLATERLNRVMLDREGSVWFGTENGASKHVPGAFSTYTTDEGLPHPFVRAMALGEDGRVWLGTRDGVVYEDGGRFTRVHLPDVPNQRVYSLARAPHEGMFIGTRLGLVWYRNGRTTLYGEKDGIPGQAIMSMVADGRGGMILGTERGLARWRDGRIEPLGPPELSSAGVMSLARDSRGRIWLGRATGGPVILDGDSITVLDAARGGSDQSVWDMREDARGRMWVGTNGDGVLLVDGDSVLRMGTRDGLASPFIWQVVVDSRGDSWLFGNQGLDRVSGGRITHYGRGDGLRELEGTATAAVEDREGNLWFGTAEGAMRYAPALDVRSSQASPATIEEVAVEGAPLDLPRAGRGAAPRLGQGTIRITFSSPTFRDEGAVRFRYRLVGSSHQWSAPVTDRSVTFAGLAPGSYRFEVVAADGNVEGVAPAAFAFIVAPHFWQSWWFQALVALALVACASTIPALRARGLERERRRLEALVAAHTRELADRNLRLERSNNDLEYFAYIASHDLQEPLRKIQAFSDRVGSRYADRLDDQGRDYLGRMSNAAARMQQLIDALLTLSRVSTRPRASEPVELADIVREVVGDLEVRIQSVSGRVEVGPLPRTVGDHVQLRQLFQNLIGNALKFHREGEPPVVHVDATRAADGATEIRVRDEGIGFDPTDAERIFLPFQRLHGRSAYEGTGIGLTICQKIVERHGGSIRAESAPGAGTSFVVILPIHDATRVLHAA